MFAGLVTEFVSASMVGMDIIALTFDMLAAASICGPQAMKEVWKPGTVEELPDQYFFPEKNVWL